MSPEKTLEHGTQYPYDDRSPTDAAHRAALGVLAELQGRGGIDHALDSIEDDETRVEIVDALAEIIRVAWLKSV